MINGRHIIELTIIYVMIYLTFFNFKKIIKIKDYILKFHHLFFKTNSWVFHLKQIYYNK